MQQALAGEVLEWLARPAGECGREELMEMLNACRLRMYQMHPQIPLFERQERIDVQEFCEAGQQFPYAGITLPREFQTATQVWAGGCAANLYSSWREWQRGYPAQCECGLSTYQVPGNFSVERDLRMGAPSPLRLHCEREEDEGKLVTVRCKDFAGVKRDWQVKLTVEPQSTDWPVSHIEQDGGVSKTRTVGHVVLAEICGRVLGRYAPDELVPGYKRLKLSGLCNQDRSVYVRGLRQYFKIYSEDQIVETDNATAFENLARFLVIDRERGSDKREAAYHYAAAQNALIAEHSRSMGRPLQLSVRTPLARPASLGSPYGIWN